MTDRTYTEREIEGIVNLTAAVIDYDHIIKELHDFQTDIGLAEYAFDDHADKMIRSICRQANEIKAALEKMREDLRDLRLEVGS